MTGVTIISMYPLKIGETKPLLQPGYFEIPAAKDNDFEILYVEGSKFAQTVDFETDRKIWVPVLPEVLAESIINDFLIAKIGVMDGDSPETSARPGLFWVEGKWNKAQVKEKFKERLDLAFIQQKNWYRLLVEEANNVFAVTRQTRAVADIMKEAAKRLGMTSLPWMSAATANKVNCKFCKSSIEADTIICPVCVQVLDRDAFKKLGGIEQPVGATK